MVWEPLLQTIPSKKEKKRRKEKGFSKWFWWEKKNPSTCRYSFPCSLYSYGSLKYMFSDCWGSTPWMLVQVDVLFVLTGWTLVVHIIYFFPSCFTEPMAPQRLDICFHLADVWLKLLKKLQQSQCPALKISDPTFKNQTTLTQHMDHLEKRRAVPLLLMRWVLARALSIDTPWISTQTWGSTMELGLSVLILGNCWAEITCKQHTKPSVRNTIKHF